VSRSKTLAAILAIMYIGEFVSFWVYFVEGVRKPTFAQLTHSRKGGLAWGCITVIFDVLIVVTLIQILRRNRGVFSKTDTMINRLVYVTMATGLVPTFFTIATLVSLGLLPKAQIYVPFFEMSCKLYPAALLATLNLRERIRGTSRSRVITTLSRFVAAELTELDQSGGTIVEQ